MKIANEGKAGKLEKMITWQSPSIANWPAGQKHVFLRHAAGSRGSGHERFAAPPDSVQTCRVGGSAVAAMVPSSGFPLRSSTARFGNWVARDAAFALVKLLLWTSLRAGGNGRAAWDQADRSERPARAHHERPKSNGM